MNKSEYVIGVDFAAAADHTKLTVMDFNNGEVFATIDTSGSWEDLIGDIINIGDNKIIVARNGVGGGFIERCESIGIIVYSYLRTKRKR